MVGGEIGKLPDGRRNGGVSRRESRRRTMKHRQYHEDLCIIFFLLCIRNSILGIITPKSIYFL